MSQTGVYPELEVAPGRSYLLLLICCLFLDSFFNREIFALTFMRSALEVLQQPSVSLHKLISVWYQAIVGEQSKIETLLLMEHKPVVILGFTFL